MFRDDGVGLVPPVNERSWVGAGDMASDDVDEDAPAPAYAEK